MKQKILLLTLFFSAFICVNMFAVNIGETAPELNVKEWLAGKPLTISKEHNRNIIVFFFWATWDNGSTHLFNFISREKEIFENENIVFVGMSKEEPYRIKNFLKKINNTDLHIAADYKAETYDNYMVGTQGVPMFFVIGKNSKIIWKGPPFEIDRVIKRVLAGTFNQERQEKIEELRKKIRTASLLFKTDMILALAGDILKIDPTDETAISIIVNDYIKTNKLKQAIKFISGKKIQVHGNKYIMRFLYYYELKVIESMNTGEAKPYLLHFIRSYVTSFSNSPKELNELVSAILKEIPFEIWPLDSLIKISERAVKLETLYNRNPENMAIYLQTAAKMYYYAGKIKDAFTTQDKANNLFQNAKEKEKGQQIAEYYKNTLSINVSKTASTLGRQYIKSSDNLGKYLQTLARIYYYTGWIKKAYITQNKANSLLENPKDREAGRQISEYYKVASKISS